MPSSVPVLANLGTAYAEAGRFADAERVFNDALRLQPSNFQVQKSLAGVRASADSLRRSGH
jgi:cytochrome c-type biogenesis protein CcmH/NrfG